MKAGNLIIIKVSRFFMFNFRKIEEYMKQQNHKMASIFMYFIKDYYDFSVVMVVTIKFHLFQE